MRYIFFDPGRSLPLKPADTCLGHIWIGYELSEYLENKGVKDIKKLAGFVHNFLQDPFIFFDYTEAESNGMVKKLDQALALFRIEGN